MPSRTTSRGASDLNRFAGVGVQFAGTIGVFAYAGYWADGKLDSSPWLMIVGVFMGFGGGLVSLVHKLGPRTPVSDSVPDTPPESPTNDDDR
jgi:F0F1-type ATP synthase assembly protein I